MRGTSSSVPPPSRGHSSNKQKQRSEEVESEEVSDDHPGDSHAQKDARKLRRLLRNRVSAQQARERKKNHLTSLQELVR